MTWPTYSVCTAPAPRDPTPPVRFRLTLALGLVLVTMACTSDPVADVDGIVTVASSVAGASSAPPAPFSSLTSAAMRVATDEHCVLVADTADERGTGLMDATDLGRFAGMVFLWDEATSGEFYMFQTELPLSIAFIDAAGAVITIRDMAPCPDAEAANCPRYGAAAPYMAALEVPQGDLADLGIVVGSTVTFGGGC